MMLKYFKKKTHMICILGKNFLKDLGSGNYKSPFLNTNISAIMFHMHRKSKLYIVKHSYSEHSYNELTLTEK